jgi:aspartate aminotransferase-like enzyme
MRETETRGFEVARNQQWELGRRVRALLLERGFASVAGAGFEAPGVVVSYTTDPEIQSAKKFVALGLQAAAGVPLQCDEPAAFRSFRLGLFGLDKLGNVERTIATLEDALNRLA